MPYCPKHVPLLRSGKRTHLHSKRDNPGGSRAETWTFDYAPVNLLQMASHLSVEDQPATNWRKKRKWQNRRKNFSCAFLKRLSKLSASPEFVGLVELSGFRASRVSGSHRIYIHPPVRVGQPPGRPWAAKPYQIRQFSRSWRRYNLHLEDA